VDPADHSFDVATGLQVVGAGSGDAVTFRCTIDESYTVGDKPNGGYLLALLGRAGRQVGNDNGAHDWEVVASTITYLRPPELGPAEVRATVLRRGRTASHVRTVLVQNGADLVDAVFVISGLPPAGSVPRYDDTLPLTARDPEDCFRLPPHMPSGVRVGMMEILDLRVDPSTLPFTDSPPVSTGDAPMAELRGWTRFANGREPDPLSLLFFADAIPPATMMIGSSGWVPTLQMSTYVRAVPAPGWVGIRITAHVVTGGMVDETTTLWDSTGQVVGQATQLARLRFPDEVS
jgi:acyl-coenzyme A thioesterase PaaI-like protein